MLKLNLSLRKFLEISFAILVMILMSKKMTTQLYIMSGKSLLFSNTNFYLATFLVFALLLLYQGVHWKQKASYFLAFIIMMILVIFSPLLTSGNLGTIVEIRNMIFSYTFVILLFVVMANRMTFIYKKEIITTIVIFSLLQSILGISQALLTKTFVPVEDNGESFVNTIYYLNGVSSKYSYYLNLGARIRAFGMTDSGLTLSLFALLGLVLQSVQRNRILAIGLSGIFLFAIYLSYTRLVWLLAILSIVLMFFKSQLSDYNYRKILSSVVFGGLTLQVLFIIFVMLNSFIRDFVNFPTLTSRLLGLNYYFETLEFDWLRVLVGQNFLNRISEFVVYSLDNELLKIFADIGMIGLVLVQYSYLSSYKQLLKNNSIFLGFIVLFTLGGFGNVLNYFFIPVAMLAILTMEEPEGENLSYYSGV